MKKSIWFSKKWKEFEIKSKKIKIFDIKILNYTYPELELEIEVSAGTYIRSIAKDLWNILETGWYLSKLKRTKIANLDEKLSLNLNKLSIEDFKPLSVKKIFNNKYFLEKSENWTYNNWKITREDFRRLNDWLERNKKYNLEIGKNYFLFDGEKITNIVLFDWDKLIPIKKII